MRLSFWRKCRVCFRWLRRTLLAAVLAVLCVFLWFNQIGLPDFLKKPLVEKLHERGIQLEFSRLRLNLVRGLVAENVKIGDLKIAGSPSLTLAEAQVQLNFPALFTGRLQVDGLALHQGRLLLPLSPTNTLSLDNIQSGLRFQTNDTWSLDNFKADFAGAKLALSGDLAHAPEIRNWEIFHLRKTGGNGAWRGRLEKIYVALAKTRYASPPQLSLSVSGDVRDIDSLAVRLTIAQAKTQLELDGGMDDVTNSFHTRIHGAIEPEIIRPFLAGGKGSNGLNHFTFAEPLHLDVNARGRFTDLRGIGADGQAALTNFTLRGQSVDSVAAQLFYTNRVLELSNPRLARAGGAQTMTAEKVVLDFKAMQAFFTNGFSTVDPAVVGHAIGPKTAKLLAPYHFLQPPAAAVNGNVPLREMNGPQDTVGTDLRIDVVGGAPFQWQKINLTTVTGTIHWLGGSLILTNVAAALYDGTGSGSAYFDFRVPHPGADYNFAINVRDVNLHLLTTDFSSPTNHLEGALTGQLTVTKADTRDWDTWNGFGHASLRDGLLWDVPVFGIFSPALNTVSPGLGNSRATEASAKFTITNGVFYTDSLDIHSMMTQLKYDGTIDLHGAVSARVRAQLLHQFPVIGPLIAGVFYPVGKLFEYKVSGTVKNPKSEPVYVPKFLLIPLHPLRSLGELFPADSPATNAPPKK
jgi:hypothetical protein